jgi:hypothetical protein
MELVIIALIAVEVVIVRAMVIPHSALISCTSPYQALIRDGPELWQMAFGSHIDDSQPAPHS